MPRAIKMLQGVAGHRNWPHLRACDAYECANSAPSLIEGAFSQSFYRVALGNGTTRDSSRPAPRTETQNTIRERPCFTLINARALRRVKPLHSLRPPRCRNLPSRKPRPSPVTNLIAFATPVAVLAAMVLAIVAM